MMKIEKNLCNSIDFIMKIEKFWCISFDFMIKIQNNSLYFYRFHVYL